MKGKFRLLSLTLIISMLVSTFPMEVFASVTDNPKIDAQMGVQSVPKKPEAQIVGEIIEKRERDIKYFFKDDNSYEAAIYPFPVHYMNNGKWEDIDNTLNGNKDDEGNDIYENTSNEYKVQFRKSPSSDKLVTLKKDQYKISWGIMDLGDKEAPQGLKSIENITPTIMPIDSSKLKSLSHNDQVRTLTKLSSTIVYKDVYSNIDYQYLVNPGGIKENIILKEKTEIPDFIFNLDTQNLTAKLLDNTVVFYDNKDESKEVYRIQALVMYDADYNESYNIQLDLVQTEKGYILIIIPDIEWLNSPERSYPVTIDPTLVTSLARTSISDEHVCQAYPTTNYMNTYIVRVGWGSDSDICRTYIKFTLPPLTSADLVTSARLYLTPRDGRSDPNNSQINVHKVTGSWDPSTINWNNKPSYNPNIEEYQIIGAFNTYSWDITSIAKEWYSTGVNNGLMLKFNNESPGVSFIDEFYSSDCSSSYEDSRPKVTINYINNSGLESYWTYHSQSVGRAGTGYINDYNGNLVFVHNDLSMNGNRMPVTINHVYNSNDRDDNTLHIGRGWRLNLSQRVVSQTITGVEYQIYTDEDGTKHYFKYDSAKGTYVDDAGTAFTLVKNADGSYIIRDKGDNTLKFDTVGYLYEITDNNGNKMTLTYNSGALVSVFDGVGRKTEIQYWSSGFLKAIVDPSGRTTTFVYNGDMLSDIFYPDGNQTKFTYDGNKLITATDPSGYTIAYDYYAASPYRISKVSEKYINGTTTTLGQELSCYTAQ